MLRTTPGLRWTPALAQQIRQALADGTLSAAQIATSEGVTVAELDELLQTTPAPARLLSPAAVRENLDVDEGVALCPDRRREIEAWHTRYVAGASLEEIGRAAGLTRERIRQLFVAAGLPTRSRQQSAALRQLRSLHAARRYERDILRAWQQGASAGQIAARLGLNTTAVRALLADADHLSRRRHQVSAYQHATSQTVALEDCVEAVKLAARILGRTPTSAEYDALRRSGQLAAPAGVTIATAHGWSRTLATAGLVDIAVARFTARRSDYIDADTCWLALRTAAATINAIPTCAEYEVVRERRPDLPCGAVVRRRLDGWSTIAWQWPGPLTSFPALQVTSEQLGDVRLEHAVRCVAAAHEIAGTLPSVTRYDRLAIQLGLMRAQTILRYWRWSELAAIAGLDAPQRLAA